MPTAPVRSDSFTIGAARPARRGLWAAVVASLVVLAAVLSAVVLSSNKTNNSAGQSSTTTTTTTPAPGTTAAPAPAQTIVIPPYTAAPKTAAAGSGSAAKTTTTTSRVSTGSTSVTTTATPTACTRQDLLVTTSTDSTNYSPGQPVTITTKITDITACNFQPTISTNTPCETSAFVGQQQPDNTYREVFPYAAQSESQYCKNPVAGVMYPGGTQYVQYVWSGQVEQDTAGMTTYPNAPDGNYRAYGAWNWVGPSGTVQAIISSDFTISG